MDRNPRIAIQRLDLLQSDAWKPMMYFDVTTLDDVKADTNQTR